VSDQETARLTELVVQNDRAVGSVGLIGNLVDNSLIVGIDICGCDAGNVHFPVLLRHVRRDVPGFTEALIVLSN
jgi:hypothetical protein